VAREAEERKREAGGEGVLLGVGGRKKFGHFRAGLGEEGFERGVVIVRLRGETFFGDVGPEVQAVAEESDVLGGIFGEAEVREKKARGAAIEDGVEGLIPDGEVDVRRWSGGHDVWAVGDADAGGVSGESHAFLRIEIGDVMRGVAGRVEDFEISRAERKGFAAFEDLDILFGDRESFAEESREFIAPQAACAGEKQGRIGDVESALGVHVNTQIGIFSNHAAGGSGVIEVDVSEEDGFEIGDGESAGAQFGAQCFQSGGWAWIDDGVAAAGFEESGGDGAWAGVPEEVESRGSGHAIGIVREAGDWNKCHCSSGSLVRSSGGPRRAAQGLRPKA
jgi:hypothetical protein